MNQRSYILLGLVFLIVFCLFRFLEQQRNLQIQDNLQTLLRNETNISNPYALAKTLVDIENIGIVRCSRVTFENEGRVQIYYDSIKSKNCGESFWPFTVGQTISLNALNGVPYKIDFIRSNDPYALLLEGFIYISMLALSILFFRHLHEVRAEAELKHRILEIEKNFMSDLTKQVTHDIASPLSALKMMLGLLRNADPEVKNILNKSLARVEEIFKDLKRTQKPPIENFDVISCVTEIVQEKQPHLNEKQNLFFMPPGLSVVKAIGNSAQFRRIVSNLLNNSLEALPRESGGSVDIQVNALSEWVEVSIKDNGIGMSAEILEKIGTKGFSSGKTDLSASGQELGVYHAKSLLSSWDGQLTYNSQRGVGTTVTVALRRA